MGLKISGKTTITPTSSEAMQMLRRALERVGVAVSLAGEARDLGIDAFGAAKRRQKVARARVLKARQRAWRVAARRAGLWPRERGAGAAGGA